MGRKKENLSVFKKIYEKPYSGNLVMLPSITMLKMNLFGFRYVSMCPNELRVQETPAVPHQGEVGEGASDQMGRDEGLVLGWRPDI